jgi:RES domain-containing protein
MVYLAQSVPGAILEVVVHLLESTVLPDGLKLIQVKCPKGIEYQTVEEDGLPEGWPTDPKITRERGDAWLVQCKTALISVPSAIAPKTRDFLLNPEHPDACRVTVYEDLEFDFESRLKHLADYALSYRDEIRYVLPEQ